MNKKIAGAAFLLALMSLPMFLPACRETPPAFETLSLNVTPPKVMIGEKTIIEADIQSDATKTAQYNIPLMVNGVAYDRKSLTLAAGATEMITFTLSKRQPGTYKISVGGNEAVLEVEEPLPADFRLSDLKIDPQVVGTCDSVSITATISNAGGAEGTYAAVLKINGTADQTDKITIAPGADYMLILEVCEPLPGTYTVAIGDLTSQFTVTPPSTPVASNPPSTPSSPSIPGPPHFPTCAPKG